jgi:acetyl esterase
MGIRERRLRVTLDRQCQVVLAAAYATPGGTVFEARDPDEARRRYSASTAAFTPELPELEEVAERAIPGPRGPVALRLYRPRAEAGGGALPVLLFFHGGGWVFGDLDTHDGVCRWLAHEAHCLVASVDYRLAPEHKFPAGLEDCMAALAWIADNGGEVGGDPSRLAVGGDSAGGNLAAAVAQLARDRGRPPLVFQLLIYPATDFTADNESLKANGEGYLLSKAAIDWTKSRYLSAAHEERDPRASPALAEELAGLPPALVMTAEYDPLRDEGRAYAEAMAAAGIEVRHLDYAGMIHGFVRMGAIVDRAGEAIRDAAEALRRGFAV